MASITIVDNKKSLVRDGSNTRFGGKGEFPTPAQHIEFDFAAWKCVGNLPGDEV